VQLQQQNINTPFPGAQDPPLYMYAPTLDRDLVVDFTYNLFRQGRFQKMPTIMGDDTNGGKRQIPSYNQTHH